MCNACKVVNTLVQVNDISHLIVEPGLVSCINLNQGAGHVRLFTSPSTQQITCPLAGFSILAGSSLCDIKYVWFCIVK